MQYRCVYENKLRGDEWYGCWWTWRWESVLTHVKDRNIYSDRIVRVEVRDS